MNGGRLGSGLAGLNLAKSFLRVNALMIPGYSSRVVLPNVCRERF